MSHSARVGRIPPSAMAAAIIVIAVALRVPLLGGGQIDYDEGVYWESLRAMSAAHPLFSSVYSSQPPGFLLAMAPFFALGHSIIAARTGVLVFFAVALVATYVATRELIGVRAALVAVVVLAVDPLMLRQSLALQADGPATALGLVSLALALRCSTQRTGLQHRAASRRTAVLALLAGAALGAAVQVKLLAVVFAVPAIFVMFSRSPDARRALMRCLALFGGAVVASAALLLPFADRLRLVWMQAIGGHLSARSLQEGGLSPDMAAALGRESLFYLVALVGLGLLMRRWPRTGWLLLAWGAAAAALAVVQHPLWPHHLVVAAPLVAIAAGALAERLWSPAAGRARTARAAAGLLALSVTGAVVGVLGITHPFTADTVPAAVAVLQRVTKPGDIIFSDDPYAVAAADRDTPPYLVDTSFVRIDSEPLSDARIEAIVTSEHVVAVYVGTGRIPHIGALLAWVRANYPRATTVAPDRTVYTMR